MDSFCSDQDDVPGRLSLSLASYGSEVEELLGSSTDEFHSETTFMGGIECSSHLSGIGGDLKVHSPMDNQVSGTLDGDEVIQRILKRVGITGASKEKLDTLMVAVREMEAAQAQYLSAKLVLDAAHDVVSDGSVLPPACSERVRQMLQRIDLIDYVAPSSGSVDTTCSTLSSQSQSGLLGITVEHLDRAFPNELPGSDKKLLQLAVENQLVKKLKTLQEMKQKTFNMISKLLGRSPDIIMHSAVAEHTTCLMSLHSELRHEIAMNQQLMKQLDELLGTLVELRVGSMYSVHSEMLYNMISQMKSLQAYVKKFNGQIVNKIYTEDKHVVDAFHFLKQHFDVTFEEMQSALAKLKIKEAEYAKLSGTKYDEILKEYLALKKSIAQRTFGISMLQ